MRAGEKAWAGLQLGLTIGVMVGFGVWLGVESWPVAAESDPVRTAPIIRPEPTGGGMRHGETARPSGAAYSVEIGKPYLQFGQALTVPIEVTNGSAQAAELIEVNCSLYDAAGVLIDAGSAWEMDVGPRQTVSDNLIFMKPQGRRLVCRARPG